MARYFFGLNYLSSVWPVALSIKENAQLGDLHICLNRPLTNSRPLRYIDARIGTTARSHGQGSELYKYFIIYCLIINSRIMLSKL